MLRSITTLALLTILLLQVGCSGASSSTGGSASYRESIGTTSRAQLMKTTEDILIRKFQYQYERQVDTIEDVYIETRWRDQITLDDEQSQGYAFARTRIIITARPRSRSTGGLQTYAVTFRGECMVRQHGGNWVEAPLSAKRKAGMRDLAREMKTEMTSGLRVR